MLRCILIFANTWGKTLQLHVFISSQDVATAFDSMDHDVLQSALLRRGLHPRIVLGLLRELTSMQGAISIPGAGTSEKFAFQTGGKQGGVEMPDEWNMLLETVLGETVISWEERKFGFRLPGWERGITHAIWADNIWLIAASKQQLLTMTDELTEVIYAAKLRWKDTSLEILRGGLAKNSECDLTVLTPTMDFLTYRTVENMEVLGSMLDARGTTMTSAHHRCAKAEACFWAKSRIFLGLGSVKC